MGSKLAVIVAWFDDSINLKNDDGCDRLDLFDSIRFGRGYTRVRLKIDCDGLDSFDSEEARFL